MSSRKEAKRQLNSETSRKDELNPETSRKDAKTQLPPTNF